MEMNPVPMPAPVAAAPPPFAVGVKFDLLKVGHCRHPECIALRGGGRRAIDFPALVGLLEHPQHGLMLYDTGYSRHFHEVTRRLPECLYRWLTPVQLPPGEELLEQLAARGIAARDIGTILISHFHGDHVAGLRDFPQARFLATRGELARRRQQGRLQRLRRGFLTGLLPEDLEARLRFAEDCPECMLPDSWRPFENTYDLCGDGSLCGIDLPGHTASQLGLGFRTEDLGEVFLVGDACWKIEGLAERRPPSRLAYGLFDDAAAYTETFFRLSTLHHRGQQPQAQAQAPRILPSHCSTRWAEWGGRRTIHRDRPPDRDRD